MATEFILYVAGGLSVVAFVTCLADKRRAIRRRRRVPERTLLALALVGGSPGLLAGMLLVRHKVRKPWFLARLLAIVMVQAVIVWWLAA